MQGEGGIESLALHAEDRRWLHLFRAAKIPGCLFDAIHRRNLSMPREGVRGCRTSRTCPTVLEKEVITVKTKHSIRLDLATVQAIRGASFGMGLPQGAVLKTLFNGDKAKAIEFLAQLRERTEQILEMHNGQPRH